MQRTNTHLSLLEAFRELSKQDHLRVKHGEYAARIMEGSLTLPQYKILILGNFYFHSVVQKSITPFLSHHLNYQFSQRDKLPFLQKDLQSLGLSNMLNVPSTSYACKSIWEALGAAYVIEGTAIGGSLIRKKLYQFNTVPPEAIHFYGCYGKKLSPLWKSFLSFFEEATRITPADAYSSTIRQAKDTFLFYEQCIAISHQKLDANVFSS